MVRKIFVVSVMIFALAVFMSSCNSANSVVYRPMCYYNNSLMWEEKAVQTDTDILEYIGEISSCVGSDRKPEKDFECNYEVWLGAKLYRDENNICYIKLLNGSVFSMDENRVNTEITRVQGGCLIGK